jgi:phosphoglycolate phosphatase
MARPMLPVAAAVFDLDGTLIDSIDDITTHLNDALAAHGLGPHTRAEIVPWVGHGAEHLVRGAVPDPRFVPEVLAGYRERYRARPVISAHLYAGLDAALDLIARRCKLAVLSNKPHDPTAAIAAMLLGRWPFAVVAGQRPGGHRKPDAASALAVLAELGCAPGDSVMIGDSDVDIATARNAGMRSIAVTWGFGGADALQGAELVVHTPDELVALFR